MNEEKYLIEYDGWIKRCVNAYIARGKNQSAELREDLYQEARMVFVEFMRKNGYPPYDKATLKTCLRYIDCRLYRMIVGYRGMGYYHDTFKRDKNCSLIMELSDELKNTLSVEDERTTEIEEWITRLPDQQKTIVQMRIAGSTLNEIAEKIGCGVSTVWDIINTKIRFSYKEYFNVA